MIEARQRETQATNARDVETALAKLRAQKVRHTDEVRELCAADERLQGEKIALENEKAQTRELLDAHTQRVITQYGQSINRYLEKINAGFRITTPTHNYRGREAKHELSNCHQSKRRRYWGCGDAGRQTEF